LIPNRTIAELVVRSMREIRALIYTKDELEFARRIGEQIAPEARRRWAKIMS
jgi:hypothetical protein